MTNIKKKRNEPEETEINGYIYENVEMFKYPVTSMDEIETEIKARISPGNKCYHTLGYLLKKRYITQ